MGTGMSGTGVDSRRTISAAIIVLAVFVFVLAGILAGRAYTQYQSADRMLLANKLADKIILAAGILAEERGVTAAALGSSAHVAALQERFIKLRRQSDDFWKDELAITHQIIARLPADSPFASAFARTRQWWLTLQSVRGRVDQQLAGTGNITVTEWIQTTTAYIASAARLREAAFASADIAPEVTRLNMTLRNWVWLIAEHAGLERGVLAYHVSAGLALPSATLDELKAYRGVVDRNVREVLAMKTFSGTDLRIIRAIEWMEAVFLGRFEQTRMDVYAAAVGGDYPLSNARWWSAATEAVDAILVVGAAVTDITSEQAKAVARASLQRLAVFIVVAGITLVLALLSITRVRQTANALFHEKERAEVTLHSIGDAVITTDADARVEFLNPQAEELTGWCNDEAAGRPLHEVFNIVNSLTREPEPNPVEICLQEQRIVALGNNTLLISLDGKEYIVEDSAAPIRDRQGNIVGAVIVFYDVTSMRHATHILSYHATHDALTGLVNRREFERRLDELLTDAKTSDHQHALCFMDLDQFKLVNDTCGHAAGDKLLCQLTYLLQQHVRDADTLARIGGDEFGVLLAGCPLQQAQRIAGVLCRVVKDFRFQWEEQTFDLSISIGLVAINVDSVGPQELQSQADAACFAAKEKGRNRVQIYQPGDTELAQRRGEMRWVSRIRHALEEDRFTLYCQEITALQGAAEHRCEILLRLYDEQGVLVPPGAFIPAAERYGLMPDIDRWVVRNTFAILKEQVDRRMWSVNISGTSLGDHEFLEYVQQQLRHYGIPGNTICFEITETAAVANFQEAVRFIETLKADGCSFALDDFGSGLSSFTYLKNLPVDYLKIDGSFVRDLVDDPLDYAMVRSINEIGHLMGMKTVGEFAENDAILSGLRDIGVDYAQGYGISHPRPMADCLAECKG